MRRDRKAEFHMGIDYAVVMLEGQTTDKALINLYGTSEEVKFYGNLIADAINKRAEQT